jgi:pyridoxal/pyridoxine/pyridoxamine kinase
MTGVDAAVMTLPGGVYVGRICCAGDLLAALLLARIHQQPDQLSSAVELAVAGLQGVLEATAVAAGPAVTAADKDDR